jgi:hypothetical protein
MKLSSRALFVGAALAWAGLAGMPVAQAAPAASIQNIFQGPCRASVCDAAHDDVIRNGDLAASQIQIQVAASSSVGLDFVEIQGRYGVAGAWSCLRHWDVSGSSFSSRYNWDTNAWPEFCPAGANAGRTRNGSYQLRVVARESVSAATDTTSYFLIKVNNLAGTPQWANQPSVSGDTKRETVVELRWLKVQDPDVREYHYVRTDPNGRATEFAVSAAKPGGQGCDLQGDEYVCYDDLFPTSGYKGTYDYELFALRYSPAASAACALPPGGNCIAGGDAGVQSASVKEPVPVTSPTPTHGSPTPAPTKKKTRVLGHTDRPTYCDFYCGKFNKTLPYNGQQYVVQPNPQASQGSDKNLAAGDSLLGSGGGDPNGRRMWTSLAAGLLLMLAAVHIGRALRDRA